MTANSTPGLQAIRDRREKEAAFRDACDRAWEPGKTFAARLAAVDHYGREPGWDWDTVSLTGWEKVWADFGSFLNGRNDISAVVESVLPDLRRSAGRVGARLQEAFVVMDEMIDAGRQGGAGLEKLVAACAQDPGVYKGVSH
jgi:hypothetical protein